MIIIPNLIKKIIKPKNLLFFSLILLICLLIILKLTTKKAKTINEKKLPNLPTVTAPKIDKKIEEKFSLGQFSYLGDQLKLPEKIPLVKVNQENPEEIAQKIAKKLNLKPIDLPQFKESIKVWQKQNIDLTLDLEKNSLTYSYQFMPTQEEEKQKPNLETAQETIKTLLNTFEINPDQFEIDQQAIEYYSSSSFNNKLIKELPGTNFIRIPYLKKANSLPIFISYGNFHPLEANVGPNNTIIQIQYYFTFSDFQNQNEYPLVTINEATEKLNQGKGDLVSLNIPDKPGITYRNEVKSANLNQVSLVYPETAKSDLLIPSFVFQGQALLTDGRSGSIIILITALPSQYLNQ